MSRRAVAALVVVGVLGAAAATSPRWWPDVRARLSRVVNGDAYDQAAERDSEPAAVAATDVPVPQVVDAPRPPGDDPRFELRVVVESDELADVSSLADPPGDGPLLATTLDGRLHAVDLDAGSAEAVLDLRGTVVSGGERGLLGVAVDPAGDRVYLDMTVADRGDTEIRSWPLEDGLPVGGPDDGVLHLRIGQPHENHNGGNLVFGPDGALWIGTGDGGAAGDPGDLAQDPDRLLGKVLRVLPLPDGGVAAPASNPDWGGRPEVWAIGLRNPWRYSFDRATGLLWIADVGQDEVEEVSAVDPTTPAPNLGWDDLEGSRPFEGEPDVGRFVPPFVEYGRDDGCSVIGGHVYRGESMPGLYGWYVYADLCGGWIRAVPADARGGDTVTTPSGGLTVLSFAELEDGELLVLAREGIARIEAPPVS